MRHPFILLLAGTLLLGACQLPGLEPGGLKKGPTRVTAKPSESPSAAPTSPSPSASVAIGASPSPSAPVIAPSASATPSVPMTALSGIVKIDAHYVIATGGGNVIQTGGGNFVSTNGGTVIATGGGNVIATGGGNVISVGGGNVISVGGGNVISTGGGNFRLLADTILEPAKVALGTMLPVRGMGVVPVSLTTRQQLGEAVLTNEKGEYTLNVPQAQKDNYVVYAVVPGKDVNDPVLKDERLRYNVVVSPDKAAVSSAIDEDTSLASAYVLKCFETRIKSIMTASDEELAVLVFEITEDWNVPEGLQAIVETAVKDLNQDARKAGFTKASPNLDEAAQAVFAAMLANMGNLYGVMVDYAKADLSGNKTAGLPQETAMVAMSDVLRVLREQAGVKLEEGYSFDTEVLKEVNDARQKDGKPLYEVKRPSDLGEFVVTEYLAANEYEPFEKIGAVLDILLDQDPDQADQLNNRLRGASISILAEVGMVMTTNTKARVDVRNTLEAYGKAASTP